LIPKKLINLVKEDVRLWSKHFLEVPNVQLNNLPACPYAKMAWLQNKVNIQLRDPNKGYISYLHKLIKTIDYEKIELLIYCDPFYKEYSINKFQKIIDKFNNKYNPDDHYFMGFHPYSPPNDEDHEFLTNPTGDTTDLPDSKIEYSMMLIQKFSKLHKESAKLKRMGYYDKWPKGYYNEVVESRQKQYKKLFKEGG